VPFIILLRKIRAWHPEKAKQLLGEASRELKQAPEYAGQPGK
jgi:hypothetical protein